MKIKGLTQESLREALLMVIYGRGFEKDKEKYIFPLQNQFESPITLASDDTFLMYWIERDESLTNDGLEDIGENEWVDSNYCKATILLRFCGRNAETWVKSFRHHFWKRDVWRIWSETCNADKLEWVSPIVPVRAVLRGENTEICYDLRMRLKYKEMLPTDWTVLEGIDITTKGDIKEEGNAQS